MRRGRSASITSRPNLTLYGRYAFTSSSFRFPGSGGALVARRADDEVRPPALVSEHVADRVVDAFDRRPPRPSGPRSGRRPGTPHLSPHGLRRRRGFPHYKKTGSLADVAELLGDSKRVAEQHYIYAMVDYGDTDYGKLLGHVRTVRPSVNTFDTKKRGVCRRRF